MAWRICSCRPCLLLLLLAVCSRQSLGGYDKTAKPAPPPNAPERTLTFESYFSDPGFRPHTPIYVTEVDVVSYIPDRIVSVFDRSPIPPSSTLRVKEVWRRLRRSDECWVQLNESEVRRERGGII